MHYKALTEAWAELTAPGAPFETVEITVGGRAGRGYRQTPPSIRDMWLSTAQFAARTYLVYRDERMSYGDAHAKVAAIAAWLVRQGVKPGDRVAIAMRNYPEWLLIYWACVSTGVVAVGVNAWWLADEIAFVLKDSAPRAIFCDVERLARMQERPDALGTAQLVVTRAASVPAGAAAWDDVVSAPAAMPHADVDPDADACIFYTSGTTGVPKGAQLTHRGCLTNLLNMSFARQVQALATQRATGVAGPAPAPPVSLLTTPLFHVTANNCAAYAATAAGGTIVLMHRWDAGEALKLIARERVTTMSGVPVTSRELLAHPDFATADTSSLQLLGGGGAQLQPDLVETIDERVATARPTTGYGMTETSGIISSIAGDFFRDKPASVGRAMPTYDIKCVDDDGNMVVPGELGELWVKGPTVIKGYLNRPDATAEAITDGWLHTGDVARIDAEGFISIVDRKKDMVLRGGENVYCAEIEACLHAHPAVAECCVFGVPDKRLGEEVAAVVVLRAGHAVDAVALAAHCGARLSGHKVPRHIWFLDTPIPRNANGKFLKRHLRDKFEANAS